MKDYKTLYENALERVKDFTERQNPSTLDKEIMYQIFPELRESEDEKIRKGLIKGLSAMRDIHHHQTFSDDAINIDDAIAWLEKQGEQKPADKVESKFKIEKDKWYICIRDLDDNYGTRAFCKGCTYHSTKDETLIPDNSNIPFEIKYCVNDYFRLWTIQDAKDGDILFSKNPFIFRSFGDKRHPNCPTAYCGINSLGTFILSRENNWWTADDIHPTTKEQCDLLFSKMKEAGYEWDAENKELKKIEHPAWSKDDEKMYESILTDTVQENTLDNRQIHWIRSLKDRIQPQYKQELNDEYQSMIDDIISLIQDAPGCLESDKEKMIDWLKSPKPHWKPTEEQMEALKCSYKSYIIDGKERRTLESLYNDLKSL